MQKIYPEMSAYTSCSLHCILPCATNHLCFGQDPQRIWFQVYPADRTLSGQILETGQGCLSFSPAKSTKYVSWLWETWCQYGDNIDKEYNYILQKMCNKPITAICDLLKVLYMVWLTYVSLYLWFTVLMETYSKGVAMTQVSPISHFNTHRTFHILPLNSLFPILIHCTFPFHKWSLPVTVSLHPAQSLSFILITYLNHPVLHDNNSLCLLLLHPYPKFHTFSLLSPSHHITTHTFYIA